MKKKVKVLSIHNSQNMLQGPSTISIDMLDGVKLLYTLMKTLIAIYDLSKRMGLGRGGGGRDWVGNAIIMTNLIAPRIPFSQLNMFHFHFFAMYD